MNAEALEFPDASFDFVFGQVLDESAARIAGGERDVHQPDVNPDRFLP